MVINKNKIKMKNLIVLFVAMFTMLISANAQSVTPTSSSSGLPHTFFQPQIFKGLSTFSLNVNMTGGEYLNSGLFYGAETTVSRNYIVLGTYPIFVDSASYRHDSITLSQTYLSKGQIITMLFNGNGNDTVSIFHDNYFNGATTTPYLLSPATSAAIKRTRIYVDKYGNYWTLQ